MLLWILQTYSIPEPRFVESALKFVLRHWSNSEQKFEIADDFLQEFQQTLSTTCQNENSRHNQMEPNQGTSNALDETIMTFKVPRGCDIFGTVFNFVDWFVKDHLTSEGLRNSVETFTKMAGVIISLINCLPLLPPSDHNLRKMESLLSNLFTSLSRHSAETETSRNIVSIINFDKFTVFLSKMRLIIERVERRCSEQLRADMKNFVSSMKQLIASSYVSSPTKNALLKSFASPNRKDTETSMNEFETVKGKSRQRTTRTETLCKRETNTPLKVKETPHKTKKEPKSQSSQHSAKKSRNPFVAKFLQTEERGNDDDFSDLEDFIVVRKKDIF
jgi:hypothetical protein